MLSASPRGTKILAVSLVSLAVLYGGACWVVLNTIITPIRPDVMLGPRQLGFRRLRLSFSRVPKTDYDCVDGSLSP